MTRKSVKAYLPWLPEEDKCLVNLAHIHGRDFTVLREEMLKEGWDRTEYALASRLAVFTVRAPPNEPDEVTMLANHRPWRKNNVSK